MCVYLAEIMVIKGNFSNAQSNATQALDAFKHLAPFVLSKEQGLDHLLLMRLDLLCRCVCMVTHYGE